MFKKKRQEDESGKENSERWLLTYSDMITLLLALFIILYSMSTVDAKKVAQLAESFGVALNTASSAGATPGKGGGTGAGAGKGTGYANGGAGAQVDALDEVYAILHTYVDNNHLQSQIGLVNTDTYVKIHLKDVLMFVPDSASMLPSSDPVMQEIQGAISKVYDRVDHITISGHTADVGPHTTAGDQVSWRLSTERAVTVLNKLIGYGLQEDKLSIEGYAHFSPIANNNTEEGRAKNRRVEITIYKNPAPAASPANSSSPASSASSASSAKNQVIITHAASSTGAASSAAPAGSTPPSGTASSN